MIWTLIVLAANVLRGGKETTVNLKPMNVRSSMLFVNLELVWINSMILSANVIMDTQDPDVKLTLMTV